MNNPLVSIIIPTYDRAHFIGETLESIIAQTYQNWECIVVDDGSTGYTYELMEFYCKRDYRIQYHHRPENKLKGANACRNYGLEISKGEFIQWFDSDDLMVEKCIEKKISKIISNNSDLAICNTTFFDDSCETRLNQNCIPKLYGLLIDYLIGRINLHTPSILWNHSVVKNLRFSEKLFRAQELDFHFRALKQVNITYTTIDESLCLIRCHTDSMTNSYKNGDLNRLTSELYVRRNIINYVIQECAKEELVQSCINIYCRGLRFLYKNHNILKIEEELSLLEKEVIVNEKYIIWKLRLIIYLVVFKLFKREYRLKNHLFSLNKYINY